jgi:hypothetical protein
LKRPNKHNAKVFVAVMIVTCIYLVIAIIFYPDFIKDCLFILAAFIVFYFVEKKYPLSLSLVLVGTIPFLIHLSGVMFNFYAYYIGGIGYDKYMHFISGISITLIFAYWFRKIKYAPLIAFLIMMGFSGLNEINEFIGQRYIEFTGPTLFSQGDGLPSSLNDLQVYDTWWDMIFDAIGGIVAIIILIFTGHSHAKRIGS